MLAHRPPAGPRVKQVSVRLAIPVAQRLATTARALGRSQARIVTDALALHFDHLSSRERHLIEEMLAVRQGRPKA